MESRLWRHHLDSHFFISHFQNIESWLIDHQSPIYQWEFQDPKLEVPTIYKAYVREYPHKILPYIVQYLHFRILEFPLNIEVTHHQILAIPSFQDFHDHSALALEKYQLFLSLITNVTKYKWELSPIEITMFFTISNGYIKGLNSWFIILLNPMNN